METLVYKLGNFLLNPAEHLAFFFVPVEDFSPSKQNNPEELIIEASNFLDIDEYDFFKQARLWRDEKELYRAYSIYLNFGIPHYLVTQHARDILSNPEKAEHANFNSSILSDKVKSNLRGYAEERSRRAYDLRHGI